MDYRRVGSTISSTVHEKRRKKKTTGLFVQPKGNNGDAVRSSGFELQRPENDRARERENIRQISGGSCSHRAAVLRLGLEEAPEPKKRKRQTSGTRLRRSRVGCSSYTDHVSLSSIEANTHFCNKCSNLGCYRFLCASCGYNRTGNYTSCQGCAKTFI